MSSRPPSEPATPLRGYAICTEQRSGSSFLCQALASTGVLGRPAEYFNGVGIATFVPGYPQDPDGQFAEILQRGATDNGIYGVKLFSSDFDRLAARKWTKRLPNLHFISLVRRDLLGQAISVTRLAQTHQYWAGAEAVAEPFYDRARIAREIHRLAWGQARWAAFFARCGLAPLHLEYEEFAANPQSAADKVARLLGWPGPAPINPRQIYTRVQRDCVSAEWRARFLAEARDLSFLDAPLPPAPSLRALRRLLSPLRRVLRRQA